MDFSTLLLVAPVLLFSMVAHEYAHGYAALKQGDPTAYQLGRLTWNPAKHIDPVMTILVPAMLFVSSGGRFLFGGAKPVPVEPRNYRHYKRGDIIVSLAGIVTNLALAAVFTVVLVLLGVVGRQLPGALASLQILQAMAAYGITVNLVLAFFNLLPIPPLDGSHVMKYLLPPALSLRYQQLGRFGFLLLLPILWFGGGILRWWLTPAYVLEAAAMRVAAPFLLGAALP